MIIKYLVESKQATCNETESNSNDEQFHKTFAIQFSQILIAKVQEKVSYPLQKERESVMLYLNVIDLLWESIFSKK